MSRKYLLPPAALAALLLVLTSFTRAGDPPQQPPTRLPLTPRDIKESLGTHWYGVYLHDKKTGTKKIGYFRSTLAREGDGDKARLVESSEMSMKLTSLGRKGEMKQSQRVEFDARAPYKIARAEFHSNADTTQTILCIANLSRSGGSLQHTAALKWWYFEKKWATRVRRRSCAFHKAPPSGCADRDSRRRSVRE